MSDDKDKKEEYKGPGKFTAAYGRASVEQPVGALGGAGVGAAIGAAVPGNRKLNAAVGAAAGAMVGAGAGIVHGAVKGWKNATKGKEQFDEAMTQVDKLKAREEMRALAKDETKGR
jgi:hypothetical protein